MLEEQQDDNSTEEQDMNCNCQNCRSEGYFEHVNGFIPKDCKWYRVKVEPENRRWETFEGDTGH